MTAASLPDARAALAALPGRFAGWRAQGRPFEASPDARAAAVLVLFGRLDDVPATFGALEGNPVGHGGPASRVGHDLDVLLLERAASLRSHAGQVAFPGGRVDPGDAGPVAAALREAVEETGLDASGVEVLGTLPTLPLAASDHLVTPVLAWWASPSPVGVVDVGESAHVFRAPVADLTDPANRASTVSRVGARTYRGPAFEVDGHLVWGFTAYVLDSLLDALGWALPWDASREVDPRAPRPQHPWRS